MSRLFTWESVPEALTPSRSAATRGDLRFVIAITASPDERAPFVSIEPDSDFFIAKPPAFWSMDAAPYAVRLPFCFHSHASGRLSRSVSQSST